MYTFFWGRLYPGKLLITGDFNLHVDDREDSSAMKFLDIIETCGLRQHIHKTTHRSGHTLDLLITRISESILHGYPIVDYRISDHDTILSKLAIPKPPPVVKRITFRKLKDIGMCDFKKDITESVLLHSPPQDLDSLVLLYNSTLSMHHWSHSP